MKIPIPTTHLRITGASFDRNEVISSMNVAFGKRKWRLTVTNVIEVDYNTLEPKVTP